MVFLWFSGFITGNGPMLKGASEEKEEVWRMSR